MTELEEAAAAEDDPGPAPPEPSADEVPVALADDIAFPDPPLVVDLVARLKKQALRRDLVGLEAPPLCLAHYEIQAHIGDGGMGRVFRAYDQRLHRPVALKLLHAAAASSDEAQARMLREARALAKVSHPNVVGVFDADRVDEGVYIAMELVSGQTLRQWLRSSVGGEHRGDGPLSPEEIQAVARMFVQVGRGLEAAHEAGIVHRDFKLDNVLVGGDGRPRVVDFGLARAPRAIGLARTARSSGPRDGLTATGALIGTPAAMSPEQWRGEPVDARSDQFSFCVALHQALFRRHPFDAEDEEGLRHNACDEAPTVPSTHAVPERVVALLQRGLNKRPDDRFASMGELLAALEQAAGLRSTARLDRVPLILAGVMWAMAPVGHGLHLAGVLVVDAQGWVVLSGMQLLVLAAVLVAFRSHFVRAMPPNTVPIIAYPLLALMLHRLLVLLGDAPASWMFVYDYVLIACHALVVARFLDPRFVVVGAVALFFATVGATSPLRAPESWAWYMVAVPVIMTVLFRGARPGRWRPSTSIRAGDRGAQCSAWRSSS